LEVRQLAVRSRRDRQLEEFSVAWVHDLATEPPLWRWTKGLLKASAGVSAAVICLSLLGGVTAHFSAAPAPTSSKATEAATQDKVASSADAVAQRTRKARMIPTDRSGSPEATLNASGKVAEVKPGAGLKTAAPATPDTKPTALTRVAEQALAESLEPREALSPANAVAPEAAPSQLATNVPAKANAAEASRAEWVDPPSALRPAPMETAALGGPAAEESTGALADAAPPARISSRAPRAAAPASTPEAAPPKVALSPPPKAASRSQAVAYAETPAPIYRRARIAAKAVQPEREEVAAASLKRPVYMAKRVAETAEATSFRAKRAAFAQRRFRERALARSDGRGMVGLEVMRVRTLEGPDGRRINVFLPPKLDTYQETLAYDAPRRFYAPQRRLDPVLNWLSASVP
jgi:hypothetical protein